MDKETREEIEALGAAFFVAVISAIIKNSDTAEQRRKIAFEEIGIEIESVGEGIDEKYIDKKTRDVLVVINPRYYRDLEIHNLLGDYSKAKQILNWSPSTNFNSLIKNMIQKTLNK